MSSNGRTTTTITRPHMPSLPLVTAAELALKTFILRSRGEPPQTHDLVKLYGGLDSQHQTAIESRFNGCHLVAGLASVDVDAPMIQRRRPQPRRPPGLHDSSSPDWPTCGLYVRR